MKVNFTCTVPIARVALIALCLFQLFSWHAQARTLASDEWIEVLSYQWGVGVADGQSIRATLANLVPPSPDDQPRSLIAANLILFDRGCNEVAQTDKVEIAHSEFHSFDIRRGEIVSRDDRENARVQVFGELKVYLNRSAEGEAPAIGERAAEFLPASFELINDTGETSVASVKDGTSNTLFVGERRLPGAGMIIGDGSVRFISYSVGIVPGQSLLFSARNLSTSEPGATGEPITLQLKVFDKNGDVVAVSPEIEIPQREFRTLRFNYNDFATAAGEPGTARNQVRTIALWGVRSRNRIPVSVSLEIVGDTGRTALGLSSGGTFSLNAGFWQ